MICNQTCNAQLASELERLRAKVQHIRSEIACFGASVREAGDAKLYTQWRALEDTLFVQYKAIIFIMGRIGEYAPETE